MKSILIGFAAIAIFVIIWSILSSTQTIDSELFPLPNAIFFRTSHLLFNGEFWTKAILPSMIRLITATLVVVPIAVILAIGAGLLPIIDSIIKPFFNFTFPLPKVAILPLILATFGLNDLSKIFLISIGMFYPIFLNVRSGVHRLRQSGYHDVVEVYKVRGFNLIYRFYFLGLMADFRTGIRTAVGYGFTLVIVSEISASNNGIGNFIWRSWDAYNILDVYAGIFILCAFGCSIQSALSLSKPVEPR